MIITRNGLQNLRRDTICYIQDREIHEFALAADWHHFRHSLAILYSSEDFLKRGLFR